MDQSQVAPGTTVTVSAPSRMATALSAPVMVLLSMFSTQLGAALAKVLLATHASSTIVLLRTGFAAIVLWMIARPRISQYSKRQWSYAAMLGVTITALGLAFYESVARIPLGTAMTIQFLGPLAVAVAASRKVQDLVWPIVALAGVLLLAPTGNLRSLSVTGMAFALAGATAWAAYVILARRTTAMFSGIAGLTLTMTFAAACVLPLDLSRGSSSLLDPFFLFEGFVVSILSTLIPFSLEFFAFKRMSSRTFGILVTGDPLVAALIGLFVLNEHLAPRAWLALSLVSIAMLGVMSQDKKSQTYLKPQ